jgi:hypothetical protein
MASLLDKVKGKSSGQREELEDEGAIVSREITNVKQQVKALTDSQGVLSKRLQEFSTLLAPYMKETRVELDTMKQTVETLVKGIESMRKGGYVGNSASMAAATEEVATEGSLELPKGPITSIMLAADTLVKTAHELSNTTATFFPKIQKFQQDLVDQLSLIHQKLSTFDARVTTVEKVLRIKTPASGGEQPEATVGLGNMDPALATVIHEAVTETDAELSAQRRGKLQQRLKEKLETAGKGAEA